MSYIDNISRNSNGFEFVEMLGSFINNMKFKQGNNEFLAKQDTKDAYIWTALSAIGDKYAETIYENSINYIDNVSNIDLCKIKALQSMIQVVGLQYDVFDTFKSIPVEIANLMDILSINKSYLLNSDVFNSTFIDYLSSVGCIHESTILSNDLSSELTSQKEQQVLSSSMNKYIDEQKYYQFLVSLYYNILDSYVFMRYADAENGLPSIKQYIYEYIQKDILESQTNANIVDLTPYQQKMLKLKIKYNVNKDFDQSKIVDDIENGYDSVEKYNTYEQEILKAEILYREQTYSYPKAYSLPTQNFLGFNLTRYSYYREKKVKEYFAFIDNTYNSLVIDEEIAETIAGHSTDNDTIATYDKDINYFHIDQPNQKRLLTYDPLTEKLDIQKQYITTIAQLLASQTLQIAEIRDQVKLQIRKSYMRGTFLLMSYIVNEFLRYGILNKYGSKFSTAEGVDLGTILNSSISSGNNVQLIEYYDDTEYFNITTSQDKYALYSETVNEKFWDNAYNKIGVQTQDIPLGEIENFYLNQLKLKKDSVDDIVNFLSIVYEYGANNSYINRSTKEFTCTLRDGRWIGDPYNEISNLQNTQLSLNNIHYAIDEYIEKGFIQELSTIGYQLSALSAFAFQYYKDEISSANESLEENIIDEYEQNLDDIDQIDKKFQEISSSYEELKNNPKYKYYIQVPYAIEPYEEQFDSINRIPYYFVEKLSNFNLSVENGIQWKYSGLNADLSRELDSYNTLSSTLYNKLFTLSVWQTNPKIEYWPHYSPKYDDELTAVTLDLKNYLIDQAQSQNDGAMQHLQNHYDKLLGYKNDFNVIIDSCNNAMSKLEAYKDAVEAATGIPLTEDIYEEIVYWDKIVYGMTEVTSFSQYDIEINGHTYHNKEYTVDYYEDTKVSGWIVATLTCSSPSIDDFDSVENQLENLQKRCNYPTYPVLDTRKVMVGDADEDEFSVAQYRDEIGGYASYLPQKKQSYTNYDVEIDDEGNEKAVKINCVFIYYDPAYKFDSRAYINADIVEYKWKDSYSQMAENDILGSLSSAVDNFKALISQINTELTCLGYDPLTYSGLTIDSIQELASETYSDFIKCLNKLENVIQCGTEPNGWPTLTATDFNLAPFKQKLNRIDAINLSSSLPWNIQWINTEFYNIQNNIMSILTSNSEYFEDYSNNDADRLDKQILAMSSYMQEHDKSMKDEVSSQLCAISIDYYDQLNEFNIFIATLKRDEVYDILDSYEYILSTITYKNEIYSRVSSVGNPHGPVRYLDCLDYLLSGNYVNALADTPISYSEKLSGALFWIPDIAIRSFTDSISSQILAKVPTLDEYVQLTNLIYNAQTKFLVNDIEDVEFLTDKLDELTAKIEDDINYISSQIDRYEDKKEIYLKYNGTDIGYDPFYNYKNQAYSSYQIHPYLYNFVEKLNLTYPLANSFFIMFDPEYEKNLYEKHIDNIIGPYGNIKDLWKSGLFDWTSYQSKYERSLNTTNLATNALNPNIAFAGLFYPPALDAFMDDPDAFIQNVQDNNISSYYYHLNLTDEMIEKIVQQLTEYEPMIRIVAQRDHTKQPMLSTEFDIYKYAEDAYGNSLFLLKNYDYLYENHSDDPEYRPSYNEKKNAFGEVWMRIKDHPLAFPAFDLRSSYEKISQYNVIQTSNSLGKKINDYLIDINEYLISRDTDDSTALSITIDTIGLSSTISKKQHLRCFFDMELDPTRRSLFLVAPYYTGTKSRTLMNNVDASLDVMTYANSSIILSFLDVAFDYNNNVYIYNCSNDQYKDEQVNVNANNINNRHMLVKMKNGGNIIPASVALNEVSYATDEHNQYTQFVGFASNGNILYTVFAYKNLENDAFGRYERTTSKVIAQPRLKLRYASYKCHTPINYNDVQSDYLKYDIFSRKRETNPLFERTDNYYSSDKFKYAENIVLAGGDGRMTIAFVTERIQADNNYEDNLSIVNFVEYTSMIEKNTEISTYGENIEYPRSTAMIQTQDSQHINIYNSFDSFVQDLVNVNFKLAGTSIRPDDIQYFNLNGDLGFLPQYADVYGTSRICQNTALSGKQLYSIELLGPEKSDVPFTPVIINTSDEKFGRVTEDYKDYNTTIGYNESQIIISANNRSTTYDFYLSSIFPEGEWDVLTSTNDLLRYKYIIYNTKYEALPILKGNLSAITPSEDYYQGSEMYDLLSGAEIIGPNKQSYQNINLTNHINNVQDISLSVIMDEETLLPNLVRLKIDVRQTIDHIQVIPSNQFRLFIYAKNNLKTYQYYHMIENANRGSAFDKICSDIDYEIDFGKISSVSSYEIDGIYPFKDKSGQLIYRKMSADIEFKYSEENRIDREFPYLDASDVEDEITIQQNDNQNIYFFALDSFDTISTLNTFNMNVYDTTSTRYSTYKIMPMLPKYRDFYNRALTIEATYNVESSSIDSNDKPKKQKYDIIEYFNYKNFTDPQYVNYVSGYPPSSQIYNSTDEQIKNSWLALRPGESGRLDISVDFLYYGKLNDYDIDQSVLGLHRQNIASYYIMNVSDDKPKFIASRKPFSSEHATEDSGNYELEDAYYAGMTFRYMMLVIESTRGLYNNDSTYGYVGMSKIKFYNKLNDHDDNAIFNDFGNTTVTIEGGNVIEPNRPINLIKYGKDEQKLEFLASNVTFPLSIMFDMKEPKFDVEEWPYWEWLNAGFSSSHQGFIPKEFYIAFSNDMKRWYLADHFNDTGNSIPTTNYQLGYAGTLSIEIDS